LLNQSQSNLTRIHCTLTWWWRFYTVNVTNNA